MTGNLLVARVCGVWRFVPIISPSDKVRTFWYLVSCLPSLFLSYLFNGLPDSDSDLAWTTDYTCMCIVLRSGLGRVFVSAHSWSAVCIYPLVGTVAVRFGLCLYCTCTILWRGASCMVFRGESGKHFALIQMLTMTLPEALCAPCIGDSETERASAQ